MIVRESVARDAMRLLIWYPVRWLAAVLPLRAGLNLFRLLGDIDCALSRRRKREVESNMASALGRSADDPGIRAAVRQYFRNHYVNQLHIFLYPRLNKGTIRRIHSIEGREHLDGALRRGKGCILLHAHLGPSQLPLFDLGLEGYPMMQVGYLTDEGLSFVGKRVAFRLRGIYENRIPARIVPADGFLRPVMEWVRDNKVLMISGDGAGGGRFIGRHHTPGFLGEPTLFPLGAASLAMKTGAQVLPLFTAQVGDGTYATTIREPISGREDGAGVRTPEELSGTFTRMLEDHVRQHPHLWHFWDELPARRGGRRSGGGREPQPGHV